MNIFGNIRKTEITNAHGEVNMIRIIEGDVDDATLTPVAPDATGFIVGHSESGHHHVLEREGVMVKRYAGEAGMDILYAIVTKPTTLKQAAGDPHKAQVVQPGRYIITNNREFNPLTQQARRVTD